jgi:hypothetical protein
MVSAKIPELGDSDCDSLILVSSWGRDNVKIYDGCSGEFVRDLDSQNLIKGPLGILQAPDGDVLVVSETNGRLLKFDFETLSLGTVIMGDDPATTLREDNFITNPVGAVIDSDGFMYAASYSLNSVVKVNTQSWEIVDEMLAANNSHIEGIDAGMAISDGHLYLPGYDSDNIIKLNLQNKQVTSVVAPGTGGLDAPRSILLREGELVVTAERSDKVMVFNATSGAFKQTLVDVAGPTGLKHDGDDHFLVNTAFSVFRVKNDGSSSEKIVQNGAGDLSRATFVYRLFKITNDSDNDGLDDNDETNIHGTDPENPDTDSDNLSDGDEVNTHQTNPLLADSDSDGMPDDFEVMYQLNALQDDAAADPDIDELTNFQEFTLGTSPINADTDGDGENDGEDAEPLIPNSAPSIFGVPSSSIEQDSEYSFTPNVEYAGDISTISLTISNQPTWLTFDSASGNISGTPSNNDVGVYSNVTITASNGYHFIDLDGFEIEVINVNDAPEVVASSTTHSIIIGESVSLDISSNFNDVDSNDSLIFTVDVLPSGLSMTEQGVISGIATELGNSQVNITASDLSGATAAAELVINVEALKAPSSSGGGSMSGLFYLLLIFCGYGFHKTQTFVSE